MEATRAVSGVRAAGRERSMLRAPATHATGAVRVRASGHERSTRRAPAPRP
jgi:hypothetical protein